MSIFQSNYCLYCGGEISSDISWTTFFLGPKSQALCEKCENQLERITGQTCEICGRPTEELDPKFITNNSCYDCSRWKSHPTLGQVLTKNHSLFTYNEFMKEFIARFKYRGDYVLAKAFSEDIKTLLDKLQFDLVVPIPLSEERLYERGFNQAQALANEAGIQTTNLLERIHSEKQSKKSREERIHLEQVFKFTNHPDSQRDNQTSDKTEVKVANLPNIKTQESTNSKNQQTLKGKTILLFDDIYTTGSTLRHAAKVLKENGAELVISFTLARG